MTFYLLYSLVGVHYNTPKAIFYDFFIQIKPFIAFYVAYAMGVRFTGAQKLFLKKLCVVLSVAMLGIILVGLGEAFFFHVAYYGLISTVLFLIYYYCSWVFLVHAPNFMDFMWPLCISFCGTNRDNCRK